MLNRENTIVLDPYEKSGYFRLSYLISKETGDSGNFVICVHGLARNARDFDYITHSLVDNFTVVSPDMPGRGDSAWLSVPQNYSYRTYCEAIIALVKHLDIKSIDFVGTSMGGIIGMILASYYPNLIRKLVINDIGPTMKVEALRKIASYVSQERTFSSFSDVLSYFKLSMSGFGIEDEKTWHSIIEHSTYIGDDSLYRINIDPNVGKIFKSEVDLCEGDEVSIFDIWERMDKKTNILVLKGENSDILTQDIVNKMQKSRKIDFVEFKGIGHAPSLMTEGQVSVVKDWLNGST